MKKKSLLASAITLMLLCMTATSALGGQWVEEGVNWKYYPDKGDAITGWLEENGYWYYFNPAGNMVTGWVKVEGSWYYLYNDGIMASSTWIDNYYVNSSGKWVKTR